MDAGEDAPLADARAARLVELALMHTSAPVVEISLRKMRKVFVRTLVRTMEVAANLTMMTQCSIHVLNKKYCFVTFLAASE